MRNIPALLAIFACACLTQAETLPQETVIVTASRVEQSLASVSSSISVVDHEALEMIDAVHINQTMSRVPGTWISRGNGQEHLTAIRSPVFTGPGSCGNFYMAEDGIPLRGTGFCNVNQLFDANTEQAQRIEVLRGPGTSVHGANAMHGVINIISLAPSGDNTGSIDLEMGPHDYGRIKFSQNYAGAKHAGRLSINAAHDGGYKDNSGFDQQKLNYRHDYDGIDWQVQNMLSVSKLDQDTAGFIEGEDAFKDHERLKENGSPDAYRDNLAARLYSRWSRQLDADNSIEITPFARYVDSEFLQHFLPGEPVEESGQRGLGIQATWFQQTTDNLVWRAGLDLEYTSADLRQTQFQSVPWSDAFPLGKQYDYDVDSLAGGLFANADWQVNDSTTINAGLRYNSTSYNYSNNMIDGSTTEDGSPCGSGPCRYSRPSSRDDQFSNWSYDLGLRHDLNQQLALVATFKHAFRPPQATELYRLQNGQQVADIDPEELNSIELGFRGDFQRVNFNAVAFAMKKNNVIFADSDRRNVSDGKTRHYGVEYTLDIQLAEQWTFATNGTYARHTYANNPNALGISADSDIEGNDIDTAPRYLGSAQLRWNNQGKAQAELEWVYVGAYYLEPSNQHKYEGYNLLNLRGRYQFTPRFGAGLRLTNLADTRYAERADYAFGEYRYFVGEPRSVYADISFNY